MERDGSVVMIGCRLLGWVFSLSSAEEEGEGKKKVMWCLGLIEEELMATQVYHGLGHTPFGASVVHSKSDTIVVE
ncbi:hypothetical protein QJS10_CPA05g00554 [Acorus calamus]|uniref:Uncharacterized protein n=1 Tax=Acorus calamus TaxID=4465 RepID=A0AAV9ETL6_ACOCL|nr:hypothetical protein QJS10_CPA05g00554 [Acorus calamus]